MGDQKHSVEDDLANETLEFSEDSTDEEGDPAPASHPNDLGTELVKKHYIFTVYPLDKKTLQMDLCKSVLTAFIPCLMTSRTHPSKSPPWWTATGPSTIRDYDPILALALQYKALARAADAHPGTTRGRRLCLPYMHPTPTRVRSITATTTHPLSTTQLKGFATNLDTQCVNPVRSQAPVRQSPWQLPVVKVTQQCTINNAGNY